MLFLLPFSIFWLNSINVPPPTVEEYFIKETVTVFHLTFIKLATQTESEVKVSRRRFKKPTSVNKFSSHDEGDARRRRNKNGHLVQKKCDEKNKITPENDLKKKNCCKIDVLKPFAWVSIFVEFSNRQKNFVDFEKLDLNNRTIFFSSSRAWSSYENNFRSRRCRMNKNNSGRSRWNWNRRRRCWKKKLLSRATLTVRETLDDSMAVGASLNMTHSRGFVLDVWLVCLSCNLYQRYKT